MSAMRKWATPVTMGAFLLLAVTGVLMFFHLDMGLNKTAHEWLGWALVAGVAAHVAVNFRAFKNYFKKPLALGIIGIFAAILALSFIPVGGSGGSPVAVVMQTLNAAPIEAVIALGGGDVEAGFEKLANAGLVVQPGQSLAELTGGDRERQGAVLNLLFNE